MSQEKSRSLFTRFVIALLIPFLLLFLYVASSKPLYDLEERLDGRPRIFVDQEGNRCVRVFTTETDFLYGYFEPLNYLRSKSQTFDDVMYWYTGRFHIIIEEDLLRW